MNKNRADRSKTLPSLATVFNIAVGKFRTLTISGKKLLAKLADRDGHSFIAHHPRVIVANLALLPNR